jgi:hypothetical protein
MNSRQLLPIPASKTTNSAQDVHISEKQTAHEKNMNALTSQHVAGGWREHISIVLDTRRA